MKSAFPRSIFGHGLAIVAVLAATVASGLPLRATEMIKVAVVDDQLPCSDWNGTLTRGSSVDIWHDIASKTGLGFRFVAADSPETAIRLAADGKVDLAVSCFNITPFRLQKVSFSVPYSDDSLALLTKKSDTDFLLVVRHLFNSRVVRDSTIVLVLMGLLFAALLWWLSKEFQHRDIVGDTKRQTFFKGWMMLAMGTGIYKMGTAQPSMLVIAVSNFIRLVLTSIFVAAATSALLAARDPSDITEEQILKDVFRHGIGVDEGTAGQSWLELRADSLLTVEEQLKLIKSFRGQDLLKALETGVVGSILADADTINYILGQVASPGDYEILSRTFYRTPQAFVFGDRLSDADVERINQAIAELKFNGDVDLVLQRWRPASSSRGH
ncbi:MAG: transporter substrate-binding domain-containing protein [Cyanobium sp.]